MFCRKRLMLMTTLFLLVVTMLCVRPTQASRDIPLPAANAQLQADNCIAESTTIHPKVLILTYNPWLTTLNKSVFEYEAPGIDPNTTSEQIRQDFCAASNGYVDIEIVGRIDRNEFPIEENGLRLSETEYLQLRSQGLSYWHQHGVRIDMTKIIEDGNLNLMIKNHQVDEIWFFGSWTYSYFEAYMGGPGAFGINGPTFETESGRAFAVMGFENAVGVPNSLHSIGHRVEFTLDKAYGHISTNEDTPWGRFRKHANMPESWLPGVPYGVGDIENPPNSTGAYDYVNMTVVNSTADDWFNFPNLTGGTQPVSALTWGNSDYGFYKWWYAHLPKAAGLSPRATTAPNELRQNNWWKYIFEFNHYPELVGAGNVDGVSKVYLPLVSRNYDVPLKPVFDYPNNNQTLEYNSAWLFRVQPLPNAQGFLWGFFQNGVLIWENMRDEGSISSNEFGIYPGTVAHSKFVPGSVEVWVRALINGQWTEATTITIYLQ